MRCEQFAGFKFRRQAAIDRYIVDFVCFELKLVIEVDGGQHAEEQQLIRDQQRTEFLQSRGFQVLRFWNCDVLDDIDAVLVAIEKSIGKTMRVPPPLAPPRKGEGNKGPLPN